MKCFTKCYSKSDTHPPQGPNLITFTPSPLHNAVPHQVPERQISEPKKQRGPRRRKTRSDWQLNQRQFEQNQSQEIAHILQQEPMVPEVFNMGEEPSVSYLQLPTRNRFQQEDNRLCMQCGETGHLKCFSTASTWCRFCVMGTHSTKVCRQYANFMTDNPIASSRRITPVQEGIPQRGPVQNEVPSTDVQQAGEPDQRQLFPQPPTQWFQPPVVPLVETQRVQQPTVLPSPQHLPPTEEPQ